MLQNLSNLQVERALAWLASPIQEPPPEDLPLMNQVEWFLLSRMLEALLQEKDSSPMQ